MIRRARRVAVLAAALTAAGGGVALADAAGPTDFRSEIVSVSPASDAIEVSIEGGDAFVRLVVAPGHDVIVLGYAPDAEPYLWFAPDGGVHHNRRSFATYYNEDRFGRTDRPAIVDTAAPPEWERIGDGGTFAWHDHRAHWMGDEPPIGLAAGESLPAQVIPVIVDGETVAIEVVTTLQAAPSAWPVLFGALVGLQVALVGLWLGPATATLATSVLSLAALVIGAAQYRALPPETGPLVTWWLVPAIALGCAVVAVLTYGRSALLRAGLVALAAAQLVLWAARRRAVLTRPVLPTDLPDWLDRSGTAAVLAGAALLLALTIHGLARRADPAPGERPDSVRPV